MTNLPPGVRDSDVSGRDESIEPPPDLSDRLYDAWMQLAHDHGQDFMEALDGDGLLPGWLMERWRQKRSCGEQA